MVADYLTIDWVFKKREDAKSLFRHYEEGRHRQESYNKMAEELLCSVRAGKSVTGVFYGHPGIFVAPSHIAISQARQEGFRARMLPGISADACLVADLGVDPGRYGWQSFESTYYLVHGKDIDVTSPVVLWQIGLVGDLRFTVSGSNVDAMAALEAKLLALYPGAHKVCLYEASQYTILEPTINWISLNELSKTKISPIATLYVPKLKEADVDQSKMELVIDGRRELRCR